MPDLREKDQKLRRQQRSNATIAFACLSFFVCMIGAAYASVPLYRIFCQVTGYGGTTQRVEQYSDTILDKTIKVRFDANTANGLPWDFKPVQREELVDALGDALVVPAEQLGHHRDVLGDRHVGEEAAALDDIADVAAQLVRALLADVLAVEKLALG